MLSKFNELYGKIIKEQKEEEQPIVEMTVECSVPEDEAQLDDWKGYADACNIHNIKFDIKGDTNSTCYVKAWPQAIKSWFENEHGNDFSKIIDFKVDGETIEDPEEMKRFLEEH